MRFLFSRRWITLFLVVVALAYLAFRLGEWQMHRLHDRERRNAITVHNMAAHPAPVQDVLGVGRPVPDQDEWRHVTVQGHYANDRTILVRYQTNEEGASGVDVVTPLVTDTGPAVLVNRGWMATYNVGTARPDVPSAPSGEVTLTGWVRADATGDSTQVTDRSTRAISSQAIGPTLPFRVYGGWVEAQKQIPRDSPKLENPEQPDLGNGPHLFYAIQWWFFAGLALFGFGYLAWDERRKQRAGDGPPRLSPHEPPRDQQRTRPPVDHDAATP